MAVKGDLNSDGQLTVREARQLLRASMDSDFLTKNSLCARIWMEMVPFRFERPEFC